MNKRLQIEGAYTKTKILQHFILSWRNIVSVLPPSFWVIFMHECFFWNVGSQLPSVVLTFVQQKTRTSDILLSERLFISPIHFMTHSSSPTLIFFPGKNFDFSEEA